MQGMIFAAGLGTRLAPLTNTRPKALVEVCGRPLLEHAIERFCASGVTTIVINVHHFASQIKDYVQENAHRWSDVHLYISDESDELLDTGGGLVNALHFFAPDEPIVVGNADVLCDIQLDKYVELHKISKRDATLITRKRDSTRQLLFDDNQRLCGWINKTTGEQILPREASNMHESAFCGFHIIQPSLVKTMMPVRKFPIINAYLERVSQYNIGEESLDQNCYWFDVGTIEKLQTAEKILMIDK